MILTPVAQPQEKIKDERTNGGAEKRTNNRETPEPENTTATTTATGFL